MASSGSNMSKDADVTVRLYIFPTLSLTYKEPCIGRLNLSRKSRTRQFVSNSLESTHTLRASEQYTCVVIVCIMPLLLLSSSLHDLPSILSCLSFPFLHPKPPCSSRHAEGFVELSVLRPVYGPPLSPYRLELVTRRHTRLGLARVGSSSA